MLTALRRCGLLLALTMALAACGKDGKEPADAAPQPAPETASERPVNIVFIMSDDHAVQAVGAYGHPVSKVAPTPNIDRIARDGVVFLNSFVTNSLCGPSRACGRSHPVRCSRGWARR